MSGIAKSESGGWGSTERSGSVAGMVMPTPEYGFGGTPSKSMKKRFGESRFGKGLSSLRSSLRKKTDSRERLLGGGRRRRRKKSGKKKRTKRRTKRRT